MSDVIRVDGVRGRGRHGVLAHERLDGQEFVVDVAIELDLARAGVSDALADTVDYAAVASAVLARIEGEPVDLIERLAELIAGDVSADPRVRAVQVCVHKPRAPVGVPFEDVSVTIRRERAVPVVVALGANLGDRFTTLSAAVADVAAIPGVTITAVSPLVETDPVGGPDQPAYLNAVLLARTTRAPKALLRALHAVEAAHGRTRETRWAARTLDLDLVQYGRPGEDDEILHDGTHLQVPHPRATQRAFVLAPWARLAPDAPVRVGPAASDPVLNVAQALARLDGGGVRPGPPWEPSW